jgi:putative peptidoglycan lipid II flippase
MRRRGGEVTPRKLFGASQTMGLAAAIMAGSVLLSRFMGLVRDKVISYFYGATLESDIYFASFVVPDFLNYLLAGGYFSITLIPLLSDYFARDEEDGWRAFSAVFTWMVLVAGGLTLAAMILAPQLSRIAAPGFGPEAGERLARFLRIILPAQVFFLGGSCMSAVLFLRRQFVAPALVPLLYNGCIILVGVAFLGRGMEGFCWGVLAGAALGNFVLPLAAAARGGLRLRPRLRHPGLKRFLLLALPLMVGQSVVVLDEQLIRVFGSMAEEGAVSWLNYARRIMYVPVGVVAQAAGVASFPFLAGLAARGREAEFHETMAVAMRNTVAAIVPLSAWMMVVATPTVRLIFEQGRFGAADTASTALCLQIMLVVVFCWAVQQIVGRSFYARQDTLTPSLVGTVVCVVSVGVYLLLARRLGAPGVALSSALSVAMYTAALGAVWVRRHGAAGLAGLGRVLGRSVALSVAAGLPSAVALWAVERYLPAHPLWRAFAGLAASGACFAAVYLPLAARLAPDLLAPYLERLPGRLRRRFGRGGP